MNNRYIRHLFEFLQQQQPSSSTFNPLHVLSNAEDSADSEECSPFDYSGWQHACDYVKNNSDTCEGGGYLTWTQYTLCQEDAVVKTFIIIAAVVVLLFLFLFLTITADDFFCRNISAIIDHLKIPQHIAGVTFMAFGNGAPDVFTSLASALSTEQPKAGISIGELLGAGIFVTSMVVSVIIIAKPFRVMRRPILRDIGFYLVAIAWMTFILFYDHELHIWQPAVFLVIYFFYACTVIFGRHYAQSRRKKQKEMRKLERRITMLASRTSIASKLEELKAEALNHLPNGRVSFSVNPETLPNGHISTRQGSIRPSAPSSIPSSNHIPEILKNSASRTASRVPSRKGTFTENLPTSASESNFQAFHHEISPVVEEKSIDFGSENLENLENRAKTPEIHVSDQEHSNYLDVKRKITRTTSDIVTDRRKHLTFSNNKVGCVTTLPSRRCTVTSQASIDPYGPLRVQMASNFLLPNFIVSKDHHREDEQHKLIVDHGKFFPGEDGVEDEESDDDESLVYIRRLSVLGHTEIESMKSARSRATSLATPLPPSTDVTWKGIFKDLLKHLNPLDMDEVRSSGWFMKIYLFLKCPIYFILNLTIPVAECSWCKSLALIHCVTAPMMILFAFQFIATQIISGGPGLWVFSLAVSAILCGLMVYFTTFTHEPMFYKPIAAYVGFLLSVAWIYAIANEVVDVVSMIGVEAGFSHELLGLTILAWANSIGDMIADFSVARQGFPRMAISAAIGGPLFNLLIGFGASFFIAKLQGKKVSVRKISGVDTTKKLMLIFLPLGLITTLILLFVQKFNVKRFHAIVLICLYIAFFTCIILNHVKVLEF